MSVSSLVTVGPRSASDAEDATGGFISIVGGVSEKSTSGTVDFRTADGGVAGVSGAFQLSTGTASQGASGMVQVVTGRAQVGKGGNVDVLVGGSTKGDGGAIRVAAGNNAQVGGSTFITGGKGTDQKNAQGGRGGNVTILAGHAEGQKASNDHGGYLNIRGGTGKRWKGWRRAPLFWLQRGSELRQTHPGKSRSGQRRIDRIFDNGHRYCHEGHIRPDST